MNIYLRIFDDFSRPVLLLLFLFFFFFGDGGGDGKTHTHTHTRRKQQNQSKFFGDPNNVFVVHGLGALVVGCMHLSRYDSWVPKWATSIQSLVEDMGAVSIVKR